MYILWEQLLLYFIGGGPKGLGINQGSIGSPFFANLYLSPVDRVFGGGNKWDLRFFRYVDDMIFVIPGPDDCAEVYDTLRDVLISIGLELNEDKIQFFESAADFLEATAPDEELDSLSNDFFSLTERLWILDDRLRSAFVGAFSRSGDDWWELVSHYHRCLISLGIFVPIPALSRKIFKYLFNEKRRTNLLAGKNELAFPPLPNTNNPDVFERWSTDFYWQNNVFLGALQDVHSRLIDLFKLVYTSSGSEPSRHEEKRLRFAVNRLSLIGLHPIGDEIVEILSTRPWLFGDPSDVVESLAINGLDYKLKSLLEHYHNNESVAAQYIRSTILRAVRHIAKFDDVLIGVVFNVAGSSTASIAERLMATETLLYRQDVRHTSIYEMCLEQLNVAISLEEITNHRLLKNFLLLLGENAPKKYLQPFNDDPLLNNTAEFVFAAEKHDLFNYYEPDALRLEFYGGNALLGEEDEFAGSP